MIDAARRGEYDFHQKHRLIGPDGFQPDAVIRAMLEAALDDFKPTNHVAPKPAAADLSAAW